MELRKLLLLPLDDLLVVTREFIHPNATRWGIHHTLKRHGVCRLKEIEQARLKEEGSQPLDGKPRIFKDCEPGFVYKDIQNLSKMQDELSCRYLFVAANLSNSWLYLELLSHKSANHACGFHKRISARAPFRIVRIPTYYGKGLTEAFTVNGERRPTGNHPFDQLCRAEGLDNRLTSPRYPQTNGKLKRFNGWVGEVLQSTHPPTSRGLEVFQKNYRRVYNRYIP